MSESAMNEHNEPLPASEPPPNEFAAPEIVEPPRAPELPALPMPLQLRELTADLRLYVPHVTGWEARIMTNSPREYCHFKTPGQDFFHLLVPGEIYLQYGSVKFCLNCAYRLTRITDDRLYWQRGARSKSDPL